MEPGLPAVGLPPFSVQAGNETVGFPDMVRRLGPTVLMMPVVMVIANIAIAKAFSKAHTILSRRRVKLNRISFMWHGQQTNNSVAKKVTRSTYSHIVDDSEHDTTG